MKDLNIDEPTINSFSASSSKTGKSGPASMASTSTSDMALKFRTTFEFTTTTPAL
jgi:hypothetical protein